MQDESTPRRGETLVICEHCGRTFWRKNKAIKRGSKVFCDRVCHGLSRVGKPHVHVHRRPEPTISRFPPPPPVFCGGIYVITNTVMDRHYIGATCNSVERRWASHWSILQKQTHYARQLQADWIELGEVAFTLRTLESPATFEELRGAEKRWIDRYLAEGRYLYNTVLVASYYPSKY